MFMFCSLCQGCTARARSKIFSPCLWAAKAWVIGPADAENDNGCGPKMPDGYAEIDRPKAPNDSTLRLIQYGIDYRRIVAKRHASGLGRVRKLSCSAEPKPPWCTGRGHPETTHDVCVSSAYPAIATESRECSSFRVKPH